jgi:hypothetical protein
MASRVVTQESFIAVQIVPQIQKQLRRACLALAVGKCLQLPRQVAQFREATDWLVVPQPPFRSFQNCSERVEPSRCCSLYRAQGRPQMPEATKFKAAENSVFGSAQIEPLQREVITTEIDHAKWLVRHGKGRKSVTRIKALDASLLARQGYESSTVWWNLRRLHCYIENNARALVNYGGRYRMGLPISSSIPESAVNQVASHRMAKKQPMRWTDEGAHRLAQVRVADLNGELSVRRLAALAKMPAGNSSYARQAA